MGVLPGVSVGVVHDVKCGCGPGRERGCGAEYESGCGPGSMANNDCIYHSSTKKFCAPNDPASYIIYNTGEDIFC